MLDLNFNPFPTITTENLVLRQLTKDDASDLFRLRSNEMVNKYLVRPPYQSVEDAIEFVTKTDTAINNNERIVWGITLKKEDKIIGTICIWHIQKEHYRAEVGYEMHPDYWKRGLTNETLSAILNYGFDSMKLHSIEAIIDPNNEASFKLLEKNSFVKEAHLKENYFHNGEFKDTAIYSLLNQK